MAAKIPKFLRFGGQAGKPDRDAYGDDEPNTIGEYSIEDEEEDEGLDNEGKIELHWIHLMDWEVTQLQKVHDARLKQLWSDRLVADRLMEDGLDLNPTRLLELSDSTMAFG